MKKVALTGGIACGKSAVSRFFQQLGAYVISADDIVHSLLTPDGAVGKEVVALLGTDIVADGAFDRAKIAERVFQNPQLLRAIEKILHPAVLEEIDKQWLLCRSGSEYRYTLFVAEVPLLFEIDAQSAFDTIIVVAADPELSMQRFCRSTGYSKEEYQRRAKRQLPLDDKIEKAHYVIYNNGTTDQLKHEAKIVYNAILNSLG